MTLQPEYGRLVTAFCGTFWPGVADQGLTHGSAPRSNSATMRAETSAYRSRITLLRCQSRASFVCANSCGLSPGAADCWSERGTDPPGYMDRPTRADG